MWAANTILMYSERFRLSTDTAGAELRLLRTNSAMTDMAVSGVISLSELQGDSQMFTNVNLV